MMARQGIWAEVAPGTYVKSKDGTVWRITGYDAGTDRILLAGRGGATSSIPKPDRSVAVTILEPTEAEAIATATDALGAVTIARTEPDGSWRARPFPLSSKNGGMDLARTHLKMFHGVWADDVKTIAALVDCHDEHHRTPSELHQPHRH